MKETTQKKEKINVDSWFVKGVREGRSKDSEGHTHHKDKCELVCGTRGEWRGRGVSLACGRQGASVVFGEGVFALAL